MCFFERQCHARTVRQGAVTSKSFEEWPSSPGFCGFSPLREKSKTATANLEAKASARPQQLLEQGRAGGQAAEEP